MLNLVSRVVNFCNFALDARLGAGSSILFGSFECSLSLLFAPAGRFHMSCPLSSLACIVSKVN